MKKQSIPPWIAKFDHATVVTPGLFRSLNRKIGQRQNRLVIEHVLEGSGDTVRVESPEQLGVDDLKVLQGLVGLASTAAKPSRDALKAYEEGRQPTPPTVQQARVRCTMPTLSRACGYGGSRSTSGYNSIRASIYRLSRVTICRLLAGSVSPARAPEAFLTVLSAADSGEAFINVGFHSALEAAILAVREGEAYIKVNLDEARGLKAEPARLLHYRLSYLNEGSRQAFKNETLETYVWPKDARTASEAATNHRRNRVKQALTLLATKGWRVDFGDDGLVEVTRHRDERSNSEPKCRRTRQRAESLVGTDSSRHGAQNHKNSARNITQQ